MIHCDIGDAESSVCLTIDNSSQCGAARKPIRANARKRSRWSLKKPDSTATCFMNNRSQQGCASDHMSCRSETLPQDVQNLALHEQIYANKTQLRCFVDLHLAQSGRDEAPSAVD